MKKQLLLISNDVIGDRAAGPGIRYREIGRRLGELGYAVTLLGRNPSFDTEQPFSYGPLRVSNLIRSCIKSDCVIVRGGGPLTTLIVLLLGHHKKVIADLYAFTHFEIQQMMPASFIERYVVGIRRLFHHVKLTLYGKYIDTFWVAQEHQKDFLHGILSVISPGREQREISLIPFGYPSQKPEKKRPVLREVIRGIDGEDFILIWGGGVWDWLDPITLVRAMAHIWSVDRRIKLYFMGIRAPSGYMPAKGRELKTCAEGLGLLGKNVFMNDGWVPYEERTDYLLEADAGVSLHPESLETRFSFRTRNLDYVYCRLPMIHTEGDVWSDYIRRHCLGIVVPVGDEAAVADAILRLHRDRSLLQTMKEQIDKIFPRFTWDKVTDYAVSSIEHSSVSGKPPLAALITDLAWRYGIFTLQCLFILLKALVARGKHA